MHTLKKVSQLSLWRPARHFQQHNRRRRRQFRPCVQYAVAARGVNFFLVSSHKDIPICAYSTRLCPVFCCSVLSCNWPRTTYAAPKKLNTRTGIKRSDVTHNGSRGSRVACETVASCPSPCKTLTCVERLAGFKVLVMSTDGAQPCSQPHGDGALEGEKSRRRKSSTNWLTQRRPDSLVARRCFG